MNASIEYLDFQSPAETITIADVLRDVHMSEEDLREISFRLIGDVVAKSRLIQNLEQISVMFRGDRDKEAQVFDTMLDKMFGSAALGPDDIDHIIYTRGDSICRGDPWSLHDGAQCINVPYHLQHKRGMKRARLFNVEQECTGSFVALELARLLVHQSPHQKVLILSSNFFGMTHRRLMGGSIFVGDGQGLMLVGNGPGCFQVVDSAGRADGRINSVSSFLDLKNQQTIVDVGTEIIRELLHRNRLSCEDIALFVPLNTSQFACVKYSRSLGIPMKRVFSRNMGKGGHIGDVDLVRNLKAVDDDGEPSNGFLVAYGVATGTSWNCLLLRRKAGEG